MGRVDVGEVLARYAAGWFPMDEPGHAELPWWGVEERCVLELDEASLAATRRVVRRSLKAAERAEPPWRLEVGRAFEEVVASCARPRGDDDGVWLTPRLVELYRALHAEGFCHTFELWAGDELAAGIVGVVLGRAAMLESMSHRVPHAGNVLLVRTLEHLAACGIELCDIQTPTDHTLRLGARLIPRAEYERRLAAALRPA